MRSVLLLWIGRLGDYLLSTSFVEAYRRIHPEARITVLTGVKAADAVLHTEGVREGLVLHPAHQFWRNLPLLSKKKVFM